MAICQNWAEFELALNPYFARPAERRLQWLFRGHGDASWPLRATVDRNRSFRDARERQAFLDRCLLEFKRQATGSAFPLGFPERPREWELLARHHSLPSALLDWTLSPYIAAYFAFCDAGAAPESIAIWAFDRAYFQTESPVAEPKDDPVEIWDDHADLQVNPRAVEQSSVFMRVNIQVPPVEELLGTHLVKFVLPTAKRAEALRRLAAMGVSARRLFRDLDHAAATARWQVEEA